MPETALPFVLHTIFDLLSVAAALAGGYAAYLYRFQHALEKTASQVTPGYFLFLAAGSVIGAYLLGTANLLISEIPGIGRSILGSVFGATIMVELYKVLNGVRGSTGYSYVVPFCLCVIVGRIGCFLSGLDDHTYGTETGLPWGWDFGDGVRRHPVQLYEAASMLAFLLFTLALMKTRPQTMIRQGYYLCIGFYAFQRLFWEALKPYTPVLGPLNLFQLACLILIGYSITMTVQAGRHDGRA